VVPPPYGEPVPQTAGTGAVREAPSGLTALDSILDEDEGLMPAIPADSDLTPMAPAGLSPSPAPAPPAPRLDLPASVESHTLTHVVEKGESLWVIARDYSVSMNELAAYNNLTEKSILKVDQVLRIPPGGVAPQGAPRKASSAPESSSAAGSAAASATPKGKEPIPEGGKYTVKAGDSLWLISRRFGVSLEKLRSLNSLKSDVLQVGQVLVVGDASAPAPAPVAPTPAPTPAPAPPSPPPAPAPAPEGAGGAVPPAGEGGETALATAPDVSPGVTGNLQIPNDLKHSVTKGETLATIADMYETSVDAILKANPQVKTDADLQEKMELTIPYGD
jgi:LysM repeat protein